MYIEKLYTLEGLIVNKYRSRSKRDEKKEVRRALNKDGEGSVKTTIPMREILTAEAVKHGFRDVWEFIAHYDIVFQVEKSLRGSTTIKFEPREGEKEEEDP